MRQPTTEEVTEKFQQPEDEVLKPEPEPGTLVAPFSCLHEGAWYRERQEFTAGPNNCAVCLCVSGQVKCNNESCPRIPKTTTPKPTTTSTTTTTTTTEAPIIDAAGLGDRGNPGKFYSGINFSIDGY